MKYAPETTIVTLAFLALVISHSLVHAAEVTHGDVEVTALSRAADYECVRKQAESKGIGWCMWDWKARFAY